MVSLGKAIRIERVKRDWSAAILADRSGLSEAQVYRVEADKVSPKLETLNRIAEAFGVSVGSLVDPASPRPTVASAVEQADAPSVRGAIDPTASSDASSMSSGCTDG